MSEKVLTVSELARFLKVSRASAYSLVREGRIESIRVGRSIRIPAQSLSKFMHES